MADANSGMGSHREGRQERRRTPRQPGATGAEERETTPEEAMKQVRHSFGKTEKQVSEDQ